MRLIAGVIYVNLDTTCVSSLQHLRPFTCVVVYLHYIVCISAVLIRDRNEMVALMIIVEKSKKSLCKINTCYVLNFEND